MAYHIDADSINLNALKKRLQNTDLIPSQKPLLDGLADNLAAMHKNGIRSLSDLRNALKTSKSLAILAQETGVGAEYLKLLKRTINGFFPKPRPLKDFGWLAENTIAKLNSEGIKNSKHLFELASGELPALGKNTGLEPNQIRELLATSDLCRIQWVSPSFARALVATGATGVQAVAKAVPEDLCQKIEQANKGGEFYNGTVGLRDFRRLVAAAGYVPVS